MITSTLNFPLHRILQNPSSYQNIFIQGAIPGHAHLRLIKVFCDHHSLMEAENCRNYTLDVVIFFLIVIDILWREGIKILMRQCYILHDHEKQMAFRKKKSITWKFRHCTYCSFYLCKNIFNIVWQGEKKLTRWVSSLIGYSTHRLTRETFLLWHRVLHASGYTWPEADNSITRNYEN